MKKATFSQCITMFFCFFYFAGGLRGASIVDSLDTLYIMGLMDEYNDAKEWVKTSLDLNSVRTSFHFKFLFFLFHFTLGATTYPPSGLPALVLHEHNEVFSCDCACWIDFKPRFCALTTTLCPLSLTVFQSSGHSSRNQKLPVWPPATPWYRLMEFPASLKGLCGAENVINKRERAEAGSKGCCRFKKKMWERRGKKRPRPFHWVSL